MRRFLAMILCVIILVLLTSSLSCPARAEDPRAFDPIIIDGVTYYDMGDYDSYKLGMNTLVEKYLTKSTTVSGVAHSPLINSWITIGKQIVEHSYALLEAHPWHLLYESANHKGSEGKHGFGDGSYTDFGHGVAGSIKEAAALACQKLNLYTGRGLGFTEPTTLSTGGGSCFYYYCGKTYQDTPNEKVGFGDGSFAIIFSDFAVAQVLDENYITEKIMDRDEYKLDVTESTTPTNNEYINESDSMITSTASLSTTVTESVTLTDSTSYTHNTGGSVSQGTTFSVGRKEDFFQASISYSATTNWSDITCQQYTNAKTHTNTEQSTATISVGLPPCTKADINLETCKGTMNLENEIPVLLSYNVTFVFFCNNSSIDCLTATFKADAGRNSTDARTDLNQRLLSGASSDPDEIVYSDTMKSAASEIVHYVPLILSNNIMNLEVVLTSNRMGEITPIRNLTRLELADKRTKMALAVDDPVDISTIQVTGLNAQDVPYYGFNDADSNKGGCVLINQDGQEITDDPYVSLAKDPTTGKMMLTAKKAGGKYTLKYKVKENAYLDVENPSEDPDKPTYIDPKKLDNQAALSVTTVGGTSDFTVMAEGTVEMCAGDDAISLNNAGGPVVAYVVDADGMQYSGATLAWEAQRTGITIDKDNFLTAQIPGEYRIRARWETENESIHSEWLTVLVKPARKLEKLTLSDPAELLATKRLSRDGGSLNVDLTGLKLICLDQYQDPMTTPADLAWRFTRKGSGEQPITDLKAFNVSEAGVYQIFVRDSTGTIESNRLELIIEEAPRIATLTLSENPHTPVLSDYVYNSGSNEFDLSLLKVEAVDQYGNAYTLGNTLLSWVVNDKPLKSAKLTVTEAGNYVVACTAPGLGVKSNALTMKVLDARRIATLTLSENPHTPVLSDYVYNSGSNEFDLSLLKVEAVDQYGNAYTLGNTLLSWVVNDKPLESTKLTVTEAGNYVVACTVPGLDVKSNALTMKVLEASVLKKLLIEDSSVKPVLGEYVLGSSSDQFDLSLLSITAFDQYDKAYEDDSLRWYVNGEKLKGSVLTVKKVGEYLIQAKIKEKDLVTESNILRLTVRYEATGMILSSEKLNMSPGEKYLLKITPVPETANDVYTFRTSRETVAKVDKNGQIVARAKGEATITVTSRAGYTGECVVIVGPAPERVSMICHEKRLTKGDRFQLSAMVEPEKASTSLIYTSGNEKIATVSEDGLVTAKSLGTAIIRVETHNGLYDECYVKVVRAVSDLEVPEKLILGVDETVNLSKKITLKHGKSRSLIYRSMNPEIATVSNDGYVTAVGIGETGISVSTANGVTQSVSIVVRRAPVSVKVSPKEKTLHLTDRMQIKAKLSGDSVGAVTFKSSRPKIISVTKDGVVTALKKGKAVITAKTYNGLEAACEITCDGNDPLSLKVSRGIDLTKPDSYTLVTPSVREDWQDVKMTITGMKGKKNLGDITSYFTIKQTKNHTFRVYHNPEKVMSPGVTCTVRVILTQSYRTIESTASFTIKASAVDAACDPAVVTLDKSKPGRAAETTVMIAGKEIAPISRVTLAKGSSGAFTIQNMGDGAVRVSFAGGRTVEKGETLKLNVYVKGCADPVAVIPLQVKIGKIKK